jgi:Ni,Fe-hydrogenase III large subunit/Ni,Fe-hydrogenase III component G
MSHTLWLERASVGHGAPGVRELEVDATGWRAAAEDLAASGARLLALWGDGLDGGAGRAHALYLAESCALRLQMSVADSGDFPGLHDLFPSAGRLQRAVFDLNGLRATGSDRRPWLRHAAWPETFHPLRAGAETRPALGPAPVDDYAFVRVEGDGVHEVPVGPVHAGIIEPGHFRFSIVGEKVLRLEERLGYVHKGIERRFRDFRLLDGHRLAARVCGDSAVAYSWAYCQALEGIAGVRIPRRGAWLRALALEIERIANHLGDLGALGNDAGFAFGLAQFSRLKERLLRATAQSLGQRYLFDFVVPGGTQCDVDAERARTLAECAAALAREAANLRVIYEEHAGVRDRFAGAGTVTPELATRLGLLGLAGRASGRQCDLRVDLPCEPYDELQPRPCGGSDGDVMARVTVRFDELQESCRLVGRVLRELPPGSHATPIDAMPQAGHGIGLIEGWRGPVAVSLVAGEGGMVRRCHPQDPSWHNWPVLEHAIIGNIVPDFPLINKSFNLSYSGHDL